MTKLAPAAEKFVLHWGELGARWGINRTVAQIHALLYISEKPLNAEQIAETLSVARSNVSTSLRELQGWGLVQTVHQLGDRRDYFQVLDDVWEMFRKVMEERKRREIDPTVEVLRACVAEAEKGGAAGAHARERLASLRDFMETGAEVCDQIQKLPTPALVRFARLGNRIGKIISLASGKAA